jgi:hypothetical protein
MSNAQQQSSLSTSTSVAQKLEKFFGTLSDEEQEVISEMIRASLVQAAERFAGSEVAMVPGAIEAYPVPSYVVGLTGQNAPALIKSLRFPGSLAAHSIPGCNASMLVALRSQFVGKA